MTFSAALRCFLVSAAFLSGSAWAVEPVRILTVNVRFGHFRDRDNAWPHRRDFLLEVMKEGNYDFIGAQEVVEHASDDFNQIKFFAENLPEYDVYYVPVRFPGTKDEHRVAICNPVYYRKDRWKIDREDRRTYWLSDRPTEPGTITWEGQSACPRMCGGGLFHEIDSDGKETKTSLYVYSTHFDHEGEYSRQKASVFLLERFAKRRKKDVPLILTGDFNCFEGGEKSVGHRFFAGETIVLDGKEVVPSMKLVDTYRVVHPDAVDGATFHDYAGPEFGKKNPRYDLKIDFIFATPDIVVKESEIIRTARNGKYPSDHYPVRATVVP